MKLAVIPARGGSKRIPRKNILPFCGRPMMAWSIAAARASGLFDAVVVSTDDPEIAEVAQAHGAVMPFLRPADLADDQTAVGAVVGHAIRWQQAQGRQPQAVCLLYATAPFVTPGDLQRGLAALDLEGADYALAVTSYPSPIQRAVRLSADGRLEMFHPEHFATRSQDLEEAFHDAGQFCWGRATAWLQGRPVFAPGTVPVMVPRHRVQDIDTPQDWARAEWLFEAMRAESPAPDGEPGWDQPDRGNQAHSEPR